MKRSGVKKEKKKKQKTKTKTKKQTNNKTKQTPEIIFVAYIASAPVIFCIFFLCSYCNFNVFVAFVNFAALFLVDGIVLLMCPWLI